MSQTPMLPNGSRSNAVKMTGNLHQEQNTSVSTQQNWSAARAAQVTLTVIGVGLVFLLLYRFYMVVFIFFVAITLQVAMRPAVEWLRSRGLRPEVAVILIYSVLLTGIISFLWLAAPLLIEQVAMVAQQIPDYYSNGRQALLGSENRLVRAMAITMPPSLTLAGHNMTSSVDGAGFDAMTPLWQMLKTTSYVTFILAVIFMLAYYLTLEGGLMMRRLLLLIKPEQRDRWREMLAEMNDKIGSYFRGQALLSVIVGALSIGGYLLIGLPNALGLGLIMGLMEAIPMIGPILGAIPAILVALALAPDKVIWVIVVVSLIQFLENNWLVPRIMDKSVGVHAIVTILAIAAFGLLFGLGGAILAIPLVAVLQILFKRFVFNLSPEDDTASLTSTADLVGRSHVSSLRLEAQHLVSDVRNQARRSDDYTEGMHMDTERAEDLIESIAGDLDGLLSQMERTT